jgi:hypothetical protein
MTIFRNQGKKSQGIGFITGTLQFFVGGFPDQATDNQRLFVNMDKFFRF